MQQEEHNKAIVRGVLESIFNREDLSVFESHPGLGDLKKNSSVVRAAFPDLRFRIEQQVAEGDLVATHAWISGTQTGSLFGLPPSGKHLEFQGVSVARVVNDQIVQYNSEVGWIGVLMQLGVLPLPR
jgi:predicted ester cyclase